MLWWGRGAPAEPQTPYFYWLWIQELSQIDIVDIDHDGAVQFLNHVARHRRPLTEVQRDAHLAVSTPAAQLRITVQLRCLHLLFIYCRFLILQWKSLFSCFITVEKQAGRGFTKHPHLFPGLLGQGKSKRQAQTIRWFSWALHVPFQWWQLPDQERTLLFQGWPKWELTKPLQMREFVLTDRKIHIPSPHLLPGLRHFLFLLEHLGWRAIDYKTAWLWGIRCKLWIRVFKILFSLDVTSALWVIQNPVFFKG